MTLWTPHRLDDVFSWWKADAILLADDARVESWPDSSGNGYAMTAAGNDRPTFKRGELNGLPRVEFDGSNCLTSSTTNDWAFLHDATGSTVLTVWQTGVVDDPNAGPYSLLGTDGGTRTKIGIAMRWDDRDSLGWDKRLVHIISNLATADSPVVSTSDDDAQPANTTVLFSCVSDPANATANNRSEMRVNGYPAIKNNAVTASPSTANPTHALQVGANGNNSFLLVGYIAELIICNAIVSDLDRQRAEGYLAHKWGIANKLPGGHRFKLYPPDYRPPAQVFGARIHNVR